ncbi:hypothetical protein [Streptomyces ficellus]|uniref:Uncharacterized protein n=1 Tax=Streptomyces ficellus TaxID=1977088 RepID=A0A6I6F708_9ACTN|nr:hypothetical protein [Streptomyces ficellus]QGV79793.1 hypothetical protein EIZ62_17290 [Streptomyces ficellus]
MTTAGMPVPGKRPCRAGYVRGMTMAGFLHATVTFPAVLFTAALVVVAGFWLLVLVGGADRDSFDGDVNADALRLGGVPVSVSASLLVAVAWLLAVTGSLALSVTGWPAALCHLLDAVLLFVALLGSWALMSAFVRLLTRDAGSGAGGPPGMG